MWRFSCIFADFIFQVIYDPIVTLISDHHLAILTQLVVTRIPIADTSGVSRLGAASNSTNITFQTREKKE